MAVDPAALLAGPRGRRLCLEYARALHEGAQHAAQLHQAISAAAYHLDPDRGTSTVFLRRGTGRYPPPRSTPDEVANLLALDPVAERNEPDLLLALAAAVDNARYWQPPDGEDALAATPELRAPLAQVAARLAGSPHAAWWWSALDPAAQWAVTFVDPPMEPGPTRIAPQTLDSWREDQVREEAAASRTRPSDPRANWSGIWWSNPPHHVTRTTRALEGRGPVGLWLVEDSLGWEEATVHQVEPPAVARVYEIDGQDAWAHLCERYPLEVSASRRHDWYRTTGRAGRWVIPDWSEVAEDFDAVHLSVSGYLATAGHAVPVTPDIATVLAGWGPDQTCWFSPIAEGDPDHQSWMRVHDQGWMPEFTRGSPSPRSRR